MKKLIIIFAIGSMLIACGNDKPTDSVDSSDNLTINQTEGDTNDEAEVKQNSEVKEKAEGSVVFQINEVDTKPVFGSDCDTSEDSWKCTTDAVQDFISDNIVYPQKAKKKGGESLEKVTFVVKADGSLGNKKFVTSDSYKCDGCQLAAVTAVAKMKNWKPAYKDGKPVDVEMTLPVRFAIF